MRQETPIIPAQYNLYNPFLPQDKYLPGIRTLLPFLQLLIVTFASPSPPITKFLNSTPLTLNATRKL